MTNHKPLGYPLGFWAFPSRSYSKLQYLRRSIGIVFSVGFWCLSPSALAEDGKATSDVSSNPVIPSPIIVPPQFPNFIGENDHERLPVTFRNPGDSPKSIHVDFVGADVAQKQTFRLRAHDSITAIIDFSAGSIKNQSARSFSVTDDDGHVFFQQSVKCLAPGGDVTDVHWTGKAYIDNHHIQVTLVVPILKGDEQRRWAILRALDHTSPSSSRKIIIWTSAGTQPGDLDSLTRMIGSSCIGKEITAVHYDGDPCAAVLKAERLATGMDEAVICLAWGEEEAFQQRPSRELQAALTIAVWRMQQGNPHIHILLATPLPIVGETSISERYAQAVRNAAHDASVRVADWHAILLASPHWESHFLVDGDPTCAGRFPDLSGQAILAQSLSEALR
jgi:hypothetical protein